VADGDAVPDQGGLGLAAAGHAVLGNVDNHVVLDVGLVPDLDGVDVTCQVEFLKSGFSLACKSTVCVASVFLL
jgi:hypothetical protein